MAAHLLVLLNTDTLQVVDAMIASQSAGSMSGTRMGHVWLDVYHVELLWSPDSYQKCNFRILEFLNFESCPYRFVLPFLKARYRALYGNLTRPDAEVKFTFQDSEYYRLIQEMFLSGE